MDDVAVEMKASLVALCTDPTRQPILTEALAFTTIVLLAIHDTASTADQNSQDSKFRHLQICDTKSFKSSLPKMPSLLLTVFLLQLAIHAVNTFGASSINTLVWHNPLAPLICS